MKYDKNNRILTIEDISQCNRWSISDWINDHSEEVLSSTPRRSYRTNKLHIDITVVYKDYIVAIYDIMDGFEDDFYIQSLGYNSALHAE